MEEIDLFLTPDDPMPPSIEDDDDSEVDILFLERLLHDDPIPLPDTLDVDFSNVVRIFLPFFTYPGPSHRCGTFMKFNTHRSHLNESPMEKLSSIPGNLKTLAKGFYPPSFNFLSFNWESFKDDHSPLLAYVVWIFLAYLTYPVIPPYLHSFGNKDTIFDPSITINRFYSFKP
nr:hypothetical protein [Tanacetum cinerariifolium]